MKKLLLMLVLILSMQAAMSQSAEYPAAIAVYFGTIQYKGELGNNLWNTGAGNYGAWSISAAEYLSKSFDQGLMFTHGMVTSGDGVSAYPYRMSGRMNNINYFVKFKFYNGSILNENARIGPYIFAGIGGTDFVRTTSPTTSLADGYAPVGVGIRVHLCEHSDLLLQTAYHFTLSDQYDANTSKSGNDAFLHTSIGITLNIGDGKDSDGDGVSDNKDKCPNTPHGVAVDAKGCPLDKDGDGIPDYLDKCPDVAGVASASGCPDRDGDGIQDKDDRCPDQPGTAALMGCPDRDGDGVADIDDSCPDVKGLAKYHGCPDTDGDGVPDNLDKCPTTPAGVAVDASGCPPDRDGDGVPDYLDKCPDVPGTVANKGCPEVKEEVKKVMAEALKGLQFETGKDVIKKSSYGVMDNVVKAMKDNPVYKLEISGYTDNVGDAKKNQLLSEKRAAAAVKYLTDHGIEVNRLTSAGYGESNPVADNKTAEGRAQNRRVEFKIVF